MFTQHYHYDASQPHAVTGVDREFRQDKFTYDANGTRVRQVNPDGSQLLLLNGGRYHVEIAADSTQSTTRYYSIAGQRPAMRNNDGSINYLLGDHTSTSSVELSGPFLRWWMLPARLSASRATCRLGNCSGKMALHPYHSGCCASSRAQADYTYTGSPHTGVGRSLSDIGLMDYNARFYDPMLGRFTSPDSIVPEPGSVIGYNRYAYVINNPTIYTDPSGHSIALDDTNEGTLVRYNKYGNAKVITYGNNVKQKFLDSLHYLPSAPGIDYVEPNLLGTWAENGYDSHSYGARTYVISPDSNTDVPASGTDGASVAVGAISLAADAAVMGQQSWIMNNRNDIFVYINVYSMSNGRIAYNSLTIRNTTNMTLSVDNVMFEVRGDGYHCEKVCTPNNYNYIINENPVYTMDDKITRGYVLPNQTAVIPLTSSVKDSFYKDTSVSIWVLLREVRLDDKYPPIYKKLQ